MSASTPTTASGGVMPSTPSQNNSNSTPPVRATSIVGRSQTPIVKGTVILHTPGTRTIVCTSGTLKLDSSQNLQPLLQQIDVDYMNSCPELTILLRGDGSRASLNKLEMSQAQT